MQHPKSAENTKGQLKVSLDGLARLGRNSTGVGREKGERGDVVWDVGSGEGTRVGDSVAWVWQGLGRVRESIRV